MNLNLFCAALGFDENVKNAFAPHWEKLTADYSEAGVFFLNTAYFEQYYPYCNGTPIEKVRPLVRDTLEIAGKQPAASLLAHILSKALYHPEERMDLDFMPPRLELFGDLTGIFFLLVSLSSAPRIEQTCLEAGVPLSYARDAMRWFGGLMQIYAAANDGLIGHSLRSTWARHYIDGDVFRIGRLEYLMHPCPAFMPPVYRNKKTRSLAALCNDGWIFDAKGRRVRDNAKSYDKITRIKETEDSISGTPVDADGLPLLDKTLVLKRAEWEPLLSPWDLCPSIHIPGGERMPFESVKESMILARQFFLEYFDRRVPCFCCASWILNPAWERLMPNSNMAAFRRAGFAVPSPSWGPLPGVYFTFGRSDRDPSELPARNSVQKAMQEAFRRDELATGAVFFLSEDLELLEEGFYRAKIPETPV